MGMQTEDCRYIHFWPYSMVKHVCLNLRIITINEPHHEKACVLNMLNQMHR